MGADEGSPADGCSFSGRPLLLLLVDFSGEALPADERRVGTGEFCDICPEWPSLRSSHCELEHSRSPPSPKMTKRLLESRMREGGKLAGGILVKTMMIGAQGTKPMG